MENNSIKYIVYCTTCTANKKIYIGVHRTNIDYFDGYIGCGVYINKPLTYERSKTKFLYAVKKYGPSKFMRSTIAVFDNEEEAYLLESEIVNEEFLQRSDVYNTALGGKQGTQLLTATKVYKYSDNGEFIDEYYSIMEASRQHNCHMRSIWRALREKCKCKGYFWTETKYDKLDISKMRSYEGPTKIPVYQYSQTGEYECCYESISEAAKILNVCSSNLGSAIKLGTLCNNKYFLSEYAPTFDVAKSKQIISREVHLYDLDGNYIQSFTNMQEAKNKLGIKSNIYKAIKLGRTCGNYQWSFEKLNKISKVKPKSGKARPVGKYDKDWNLIELYKSLSECKKINGSGMVHVLEGRNEFAKGFRYKYMDLD